MSAHKPMTPAEHIARAKSEALNGEASYATAHALIAIAELLDARYTTPTVHVFGEIGDTRER